MAVGWTAVNDFGVIFIGRYRRFWLGWQKFKSVAVVTVLRVGGGIFSGLQNSWVEMEQWESEYQTSEIQIYLSTKQVVVQYSDDF